MSSRFRSSLACIALIGATLFAVPAGASAGAAPAVAQPSLPPAGLTGAAATAESPQAPQVARIAQTTPSSAMPARGRWSVALIAPGRWQVRWTSPQPLPVRSDRPTITTATATAAATEVGVSTSKGRTVSAVVVSATRPDPVRLEVVLSGARLDRVAPALPRARPLGGGDVPAEQPRALAVDPGAPGPYATTSSDYVRPSVQVAAMQAPIEMVGHVVEPVASAATGPRPLVVFLHGRHEYCYQAVPGVGNDSWPCRGTMREVPSHLGYVYLQELLASQGFTTVSIRVNGINAQDGTVPDGGASARATIVQRHLDYWRTIAAAHQVDLSSVVLVGHSRGGEGVNRASIRVPLTAPYRIVGQILVAPTDFAYQTAPDIPTVTLLPYCDGDVSDLQGQRYTDVARDLSAGDTSLKSSVLVMGANHNFFNTEWTPGISKAPSNDDWFGDPRAACGTRSPTRLTAAGQRAVGQAYIAGAVAVFTRPATSAALQQLFDGSRVAVRSAGGATTYSAALGGDRVLRRPGQDTTLTPAQGATSSFCAGSTSFDRRPGLCGSEIYDLTTPHWSTEDEQPVAVRSFWQVSWRARNQTAGLRLNTPLDLRDRFLDLRTIADLGQGPAGISIRITDTAGRSGVLVPQGGNNLVAFPSSPVDSWIQVGKLWAQTVRVDPQRATGVDLARVQQVELISTTPAGRLWVADLSATRLGSLPTVPAVRLPVLSIGSSAVKEGNASGTTVVRVPFRLSRPMDRAGRFRVFTVGQTPGSTRLFTVELALGQQTGTIPVSYRANRLDSADQLTTAVVAGASTNVITDSYIGRMIVTDDDASPTISVTRVKSQVAEGRPVQWRVTLSTPTDYDLTVLADVVRGSGRNVTGADVPRSWLEQNAWATDPRQPLYALGVELYAAVPPGARSVVLSIPTLSDRLTEPQEAVTLRITAVGPAARARATSVSTVRVLASR